MVISRFPIMSEKCIIYRSLRHPKRLKRVRNKFSVDPRMLKTYPSKLDSLRYFKIADYIVYIYIYIYSIHI